MAILAVANTVGTVVGTVGGIFGNSKDAERKAQADTLYERALNGDRKAEVQLRCLAGYQDVRQEAISYGLLSADEISRGTPCGYATEAAQQYAKNLVTKLGTTRTIATVAGNVASGATKVGVDADPRTYLSTVSSNVGGALGFSGVPQWVIIAGGAALLVWWLRKR